MSQSDQTPAISLNDLSNRLQSPLPEVLSRDFYRLQALKHRLQKRLQKEAEQPAFQKDASKFLEQLERSEELALKRRQALPERIDFDDNLPISAKRDEIRDLIAKHQVVVIAGETGSGKTTQLPKICLELGRGVTGLIGHTQPRRLAARTVAARIAEELKTELGDKVGFQVRFSDQSHDQTLVKLMTDGILLAEIQNDRFLNKYDTIIIDEAHERSLNVDFLMGYLKQVLPKRPDLKVIITSATIDLERFSKHFSDASGKPAPVIEVSGRTYPVETLYRPMTESDEDTNGAICEAVEELLATEPKNIRGGDILVFLAGERDIREAAKALRDRFNDRGANTLEIVPLYARLSLAEQSKVFSPHKGRRVVLSTNVAETSLTVPGIRYVIDPGVARISRYSYRTKVQRLPIEAVSQASANQRKGRCGRISDGICIRLYSEEDFLSRPEFTDAEILRTNLGAVILQMLHLRIGDIREFPFVDAPDGKLIRDGFKLLEELQAVDGKGRLTQVGRALGKLPVDPRLARMVLAGMERGALTEVLIIASFLSVQDVRERPQEKQQQADQAHRRFWHEQSDFLTLVNLWHYLEEQRQELSSNQYRKQLKKEFMSYLRVREWRDIHHQLLLAVKSLKDVKLQLNQEPASYEAVHRSLLSGLLSQIANLDEDREYLGARNRRLRVFPSSGQYKKSPKWMMAAELLETSQLFAHNVAKIEPEWAAQDGRHLTKHNHFEPHFDIKSGQVKAFEKTTLFGLTLIEKQRVNFSSIDPVLSREVFIRQALVEGRYAKVRTGRNRAPKPGPFYSHNQKLIEDVQALEEKSRRRDILVDDEALFTFYNERIGPDVTNMAGFEHFRKTAEQDNAQLLFLTREQLMLHEAGAITEAQFPNTLTHQGLTFPLDYHFEPGHKLDGVTLKVPVAALHQVPEYRLQWLVPGMLREKCIALVKALPKAVRKNFVPVPMFVDQALSEMRPDNTPLLEALAHQLRRQKMIEIDLESWQQVPVEAFYRFNIAVIDERGKVIEADRDLYKLRQKYKQQVQDKLQSAGSEFERQGITDWDFESLAEHIELKRAGLIIRAYPALIDRQDSVDLKLLDNAQQADYETRKGLSRLLLLNINTTVKYLRKELMKGKDIGLTVVSMGRREQVIDDLLMAACHQILIDNKRINQVRQHSDFEACLAEVSKAITERAQKLSDLLVQSLSQVVEIKKQQKKSKNALAMAFCFSDVNQQLSGLFSKGMLFDTPLWALEQYPRYFKAILERMDKAPGQVQKDKVWLAEVAEHTERLEKFLKKEGQERYRITPELVEFRWLIEELRVSLFAQRLGTRMPVSSKRLNKLWQEITG